MKPEEQEKFLNKLGDIHKDIEQSKKTHAAEKKALQDGVDSLTTQYKTLEQKLEELAVTAKAMTSQPASQQELMKELGRDIAMGCIKGGTLTGAKADQISKGLSIGTGADGGYAIREELVRTLRSCQEIYGVMRQAVNPIPMRTNTLTWVETAADEHPNVTTAVAEGCANPSPNPNDTPQLIEHTMTAQKLVRWFCIPNELLEDETFFDVLGTWILPHMGRAFAYMEDYLVLAHIFDAANNFVDYTIASGTTFSGITFDDLILAPQSALNGGLETSAFYMHRSVLAQLMLKKGTDGHYLDYAMEFARNGTVLRQPIRSAEILPRTSQASQAGAYFGIYGDIGQSVMFGQRREFDVRSSREHNFPADVTTLYASERIAVGSDRQCAKNLVKLKTNAS